MAESEQKGFRVSECKKISVSEVLDKDNGNLNHVHATLHHWNKYHNPTEEGFMGGELYLGEACVNCPFSDAQAAIRRLEAEKAVRSFCDDKMNQAFRNLQEKIISDQLHHDLTGQSITLFSKPDGDRIEIHHTKPLAEFLGADLLASIKWWHSGSVRHGDE
jgi:hypothetical protein